MAIAVTAFPALIAKCDEPRPATKLESTIRGEFRVRKVSAQRFCEFPGCEDGDPAGLCDLYLPQRSGDNAAGENTDKDARWPVVIAVHGGGWASGDKWTMDRHAWKLAEHGIAAVSINYRLAPSAQFPDQVDDVRSALVWISRNAERYHLDSQQVGLYGYSAGGHLVSLVATLGDESWDRLSATTHWERNDPRWKELPMIRAVCAGGPPTDFRDLPPDNTTLAYFLGGSRREKPDVY